jgi:hypothetical protein
MPYPRREAKIVAKQNHMRAKWGRIAFRDNRLEETKNTSLTTGGCWCGLDNGHDWPGKSEGKLHPVPGDDRPLPPKVLAREAQIALQDAGVCPACRGYPTHINQFGQPWCDPCLGTGVFPPPSHDEARRMKEKK